MLHHTSEVEEEAVTQEMELDTTNPEEASDSTNKSLTQEEVAEACSEAAIEAAIEEVIQEVAHLENTSLGKNTSQESIELRKMTDSWTRHLGEESSEAEAVEEVIAETSEEDSEEAEETSGVIEEAVKKMTTTEMLMYAEEHVVVLAQKITQEKASDEPFLYLKDEFELIDSHHYL